MRGVKMIQYADSTVGVTAGMLQGFFKEWKIPLSPEVHLTILKNSDHIVIAINPETGKVIGFVYCTYRWHPSSVYSPA